jgi:hypothetical protein
MTKGLMLVSALVALGGAGAVPAGAPAISDLRPITLHSGVNRVPGFLADGAAATIVEAWRGNGNAHGYHVWMVLGGSSEDHPVGIVGLAGDGRDPVETIITDDPFDGERVLGSTRFATARLAGRPATLLVRAFLDDAPGGVLADHATATVRWYRLDHDTDAIGRTTDEFVPIGEVRTTKRYCNVELALRDVAGFPLSPDFAGANRLDGCFADG